MAYLKRGPPAQRGKEVSAAKLLRIDPQRMKYLCRKLELIFWLKFNPIAVNY